MVTFSSGLVGLITFSMGAGEMHEWVAQISAGMGGIGQHFY